MSGKHAKQSEGGLHVNPRVLVLVAVLVVGVVIGFVASQQLSGQTPSANPQTGQEGDAAQGNGQDAGTAEVDLMTIATDFGDLYYPEQWGDYLSVEQVSEGDSLRVSFSALIQDAAYPMFEVVIGEGDGTVVGQLTDSAGTARDVHMSVTEIEAADGVSDTELQRMYAMQEDLNVVIDHLG